MTANVPVTGAEQFLSCICILSFYTLQLLVIKFSQSLCELMPSSCMNKIRFVASEPENHRWHRRLH